MGGGSDGVKGRGMNDVHRLHPLKAVEQKPVDASLDFQLMAAIKHSERGEGPAMMAALADAFWLQHTGNHETVSDNRMVTLLRSFAGMSWNPPEHGGDAAA